MTDLTQSSRSRELQAWLDESLFNAASVHAANIPRINALYLARRRVYGRGFIRAGEPLFVPAPGPARGADPSETVTLDTEKKESQE